MANILVIEDDNALREGIALALKAQGTVIPCPTMAAARAAMAETAMDLLLLDINLPDGSGLDFCREVRRESRVPVIFLTANDTELDEVMGFESGGDDYITKPFSLAVLRARVEAALRRSRRASVCIMATALRLYGGKHLEITMDVLYGIAILLEVLQD